MTDTHRAGPDWPFWVTIAAVTGAYLLFLVGMLVSTATYSSPHHLVRAFASREIRYATALSLVSCTVTAVLALIVAVPVAYLMARSRFPGKNLLDTLLDVPIVLPPMVIGLALLILFQTPIGRAIDRVVPFTYTVFGVVLAQFVVGAAFAVRQMRTTFDHLASRPEDVAMTLGCSRGRAFLLVTLPAAERGMFSAASVAWARSLGEFGPILVFAGATRMKTEVLPTSVWLELSVGNLEAAIAVSLTMIVLAVAVLLAMRAVGERP
jgi:molybdate transport system permease protein